MSAVVTGFWKCPHGFLVGRDEDDNEAICTRCGSFRVEGNVIAPATSADPYREAPAGIQIEAAEDVTIEGNTVDDDEPTEHGR